MHSDNYLIPNWPAPKPVKAMVTKRGGGFSQTPYDSFNLATHVGDELPNVVANRKKLQQTKQINDICWLNQVHGTDVVLANPETKTSMPATADACWTETSNLPCAVMTADCLPLLVCDTAGTRVAAIHAGWRGLANGVIGKCLENSKMKPQETLVWLGPAIGPDSYQVGEDVLDAFRVSPFFQNLNLSAAFVPEGQKHYRCDLYQLARLQLISMGFSNIYGGDQCTFTQTKDYFSYRRDGQTGRMGSLIWLV